LLAVVLIGVVPVELLAVVPCGSARRA